MKRSVSVPFPLLVSVVSSGSSLGLQDRMKLRASARSGKSFSGLLQNRKKNGEAGKMGEEQRNLKERILKEQAIDSF
jgi:hypothetical protein